MKKEYITIRVCDIVPYGNNPRINDNAIPYVEDSIRQVGYIAPIIIDEKNVIVAGHTRLQALLNEVGGAENVDVLRVSGLTDEQKKKYRYYDNKAGEFAAWDFEKLTEELSGFDLGEFEIDLGDDQEVEWSGTDRGNSPNPPDGGRYPDNQSGMHGSQQSNPSDELKGNVPDIDGMKPDPFDEDLINQYSQNSEDYVARKRVILCYRPEQEDDIRRLLGITDERVKVVYELDELIGNDAE